MVTQLSEYDDELTSILSDSYISELSGVMDDSLLSGAVESSSVVAPQETLRQSLLPSAKWHSPHAEKSMVNLWMLPTTYL